MATTTIPLTKAAIVDGLTALTGKGEPLEGVHITWGVPSQKPGREWMLVGDVTTNQKAALIGIQRQPREEQYTIEVITSVVRPLIDSQRATTERAFALVAELEKLVRPLTQPPLGVANVVVIEVTKTDLQEHFDEKEREARVITSLSVMARI